jgi:hypothetical protein
MTPAILEFPMLQASNIGSEAYESALVSLLCASRPNFRFYLSMGTESVSKALCIFLSRNGIIPSPRYSYNITSGVEEMELRTFRVFFFFKIRIVGGGVQTGFTRHVGH